MSCRLLRQSFAVTSCGFRNSNSAPDGKGSRCGNEEAARFAGSGIRSRVSRARSGVHKAVIDAVTTTLLPALQNAEVKNLVTKVVPAFNAHMVKAQSLLDNDRNKSVHGPGDRSDPLYFTLETGWISFHPLWVSRTKLPVTLT